MLIDLWFLDRKKEINKFCSTTNWGS